MRLTTRSSSEGRQIVAAPRMSSVWSSILIAAALLLVFELDRRTAAAPFQHLYYIPIIAAGIRFRMSGSLTVALCAIVLYHLANPHLLTFRYEESDLIQIILFIAVGVTTAQLTHDAHRLRVLAMTDDLTGLHNLRSFEAQLKTIIQASRQAGTPVSMLVFDVDHLKSINDGHGHLAGAEAVRMVGHIVSAHLPPEAVASRYGGDEFVVALPSCPEARAQDIADDLRRAVSGTAPVLAGVAFPPDTISISVGLACRVFDRPRAAHVRDSELGEALFRAADGALYVAKERGRNQVCVA
jgi:diguanylate cyclase (GGDEF)-like protein